MLKNTVKSISFVLLLLVISLAVSYYYSYKVMHVSEIRRIKRAFDKEEKISLLFLGDSHSLRSFNPHLLKDSFIYGSSGENYFQTYFKLKDVIENTDKEVLTVLLPLDLHSFSSYRSTRIYKPYYWVDYLDYKELARETKKNLEFLYKHFRARFLNYTGKKGHFIFYFTKGEPSPMYKGFHPSDEDFSKSKKQKIRAATQLWHHDHLDTNLIRYFKKIMFLCKKNNINVVLIKYPITEKYYKKSAEIMSLKEYKKEIDNLLSEFPEIVKILNYRELFFEHEEYFKDSDHLNTAGANALSKQLKRDLQIQ